MFILSLAADTSLVAGKALDYEEDFADVPNVEKINYRRDLFFNLILIFLLTHLC